MSRPKVIPCLWFDGKAEEAARFYVSLFEDAEILGVTPGPDGSPLVVEFRLGETTFTALNGGPHFTFNEAVSLSINCDSQEELDVLWETLCEGGSESQCGWLKDRYGLSWQVVPSVLPDLLKGGDPARAARVMGAVMSMIKLDIARLRAAADGEEEAA
ncbi:VOC family protein [Tautonia plasticadhaerens]|uniref:3-demethylubiquinone-9 3-methyltransferase n=1 Tax=Tautonia plasticadhaerens TaxID=2527974 RepID=A0A518HB58_9BACT|nr:VOC family protein [Tautonia plasticadhaerens]QDV38090.1 3-demethylubiquinone-9 3-methyltransferase [Tautonia plasticadhaerens]